MSSISYLAARCRPLAYRLFNVRNHVLTNSINQHLPAMCYQQTSIGEFVPAVRYVATITSEASVSQARTSQRKASQTQLRETWNRSERILLKLNQSAITIPWVSFDELKRAIDGTLTEENALSLMKSCSRQIDRSVDEKVELINRIWTFLKKSETFSANLPYGTLIESYQCCGKSIDDPHAFFAEIGAPKNFEIHEKLIQLMCANNRSIDAASSLLQEMGTMEYTASERVYNALIVGAAARTKSMENSQEIVREMIKQQVGQTLETQVALMKANIECGNEQKAIEMLKQHNDLDSYQLYEIIRLAAMKCTGDGVVKHALNLLPAPIFNVKLIATELQNICRELLHASSADHYYDSYELIIQHLPRPVFVNENTDEYGTFLIKEMLSLNVDLPRLVRFCEQLYTSERNTRAFQFCCGLTIARNMPNTYDMLRILATKEPLRPHYFWPLFVTAESEGQIFVIIKLAVDTNVELDALTIEKHILSRIPHTVNDSIVALKTLEELGLKMHPLRTALVSHLLLKDRPCEALNIAKAFSGRLDMVHLENTIVSYITRNGFNFHANAMTVAQLIRALQSKSSNQQYDMAGTILCRVVEDSNEIRSNFATSIQLIKDLATAKVKISAPTADAVLNRMKKQREVQALCVEKLREMTDNVRLPEVSFNEEHATKHNEHGSLEDMENHLIELESNQLNTRGILRKLFLQYLKEQKFERAQEVYEKCAKANILKSPAMLAATVGLMTHMSNENEALKSLNLLQKMNPQFKLDLHKIIKLATLLVQKNRLQDVEELLKRFAGLNETVTTNYITKNIWELLQAVVEWSVKNKRDENSSKIMLDKLVQMGYSNYTKINFGPIIREFIEKGQINAAVNEFERVATEYRLAPQQLTLMTLLIGLMNSDDQDQRWKLYSLDRPLANEMLRRVVEVARKVLKPETANTHLLTAFVISGNEQQIRKILMNPAMQFNAEQLIVNLEHHLYTNGNIDALIKLANCNRGLRHEAINEENLYTLLVNKYSTENNHLAAFELYTSLCKESEYKVSKKLKEKFQDLFARNNIEIE